MLWLLCMRRLQLWGCTVSCWFQGALKLMFTIAMSACCTSSCSMQPCTFWPRHAEHIVTLHRFNISTLRQAIASHSVHLRLPCTSMQSAHATCTPAGCLFFGQSFGGTMGLLVEAAHPGTFAAIYVYEPPVFTTQSAARIEAWCATASRAGRTAACVEAVAGGLVALSLSCDGWIRHS